MSITRPESVGEVESGPPLPYAAILDTFANHASPRILGTVANRYASSSYSQVVILSDASGQRWQVLCKHVAASRDRAHGHRGLGFYEARVHREFLAVANVVPALIADVQQADGSTWLIFDYLADARRLDLYRNPSPRAIAAATWIGAFQARFDGAFGLASGGSLIEYTTDYYIGWAERALAYSDQMLDDRPWLPSLVRWLDGCSDHVFSAQPTLIHGEYTPQNVLCDEEGRIYPVDWETAARGLGEVDLAALVEGWDEQTVAAATRAYVAARWGDQPPPDFDANLAAACLYWTLRWLGDRPEWTQHPVNVTRWQRLLSQAEALGFQA